MKKRKIKYWRTVDVGKPGKDYLKVAVLTGKGPRGGKTVAKLVNIKNIKKKVKIKL